VKQGQRLLARILKVWYDEHKDEVSHEAFICLVASLGDYCEIIEEEVGFKKEKFVKACMP
jgi:hypothetical protein